MEIVLAGLVGQLAVIGILFRWLHVQSRDNKQGLDKMARTSYTKAETKELIDLKLKPIEVGLTNIKEDIVELKAMVSRLLDEKDK